eukprot:tig00020830_g14431.t1
MPKDKRAKPSAGDPEAPAAPIRADDDPSSSAEALPGEDEKPTAWERCTEPWVPGATPYARNLWLALFLITSVLLSAGGLFWHLSRAPEQEAHAKLWFWLAVGGFGTGGAFGLWLLGLWGFIKLFEGVRFC